MKRRTLLRSLAGGIAGGMAGTVAGAAVAPIAGAQASSRQSPDAAGQAPSSPTARLLDEHQRRTLASLAETIVPGSTAAGVVDLVDRVTAVESPARQRHFLNALGWFERQARQGHGARWIDLDEPTRLKILAAASTGPEARPRPPAWTKGQPIALEPAEPPPPATARDHFDHLRSVIAGAYFSTEPGMKELGWTGRAVFRSLPGCDHPDEHA